MHVWIAQKVNSHPTDIVVYDAKPDYTTVLADYLLKLEDCTIIHGATFFAIFHKGTLLFRVSRYKVHHV